MPERMYADSSPIVFPGTTVTAVDNPGGPRPGMDVLKLLVGNMTVSLTQALVLVGNAGKREKRREKDWGGREGRGWGEQCKRREGGVRWVAIVACSQATKINGGGFVLVCIEMIAHPFFCIFSPCASSGRIIAK